MGPVEGVLIRAAGRSTTTDGSGNARLTLPTGRQQLSFARIGYQAKRITVLVVRDSVVPTRWSGRAGDGGGHWTTEVWAPLEGFLANVALRYRW